MQKLVKFCGLILASILLLLVASNTYAQYNPAIVAVDQDVVDGQVVVGRAVINGPGWIAIHADSGGSPGPVIGYSPLVTGINANVAVAVDTTRVTDKLYAMLHVDEGKIGTYEFPGVDAPLLLNGAPVMPEFKVTGTSLTILGTVLLSDGFKTFVAAVKAAGLEKELTGEGPLTVFAPTNAAFDALPKGKLDELLADPAALKQLLLYHVVPGKIMSADVSDGLEATTAQGAALKFSLKDGKILLNDATITAKDIPAHNGVLHVLDQVLTLPANAEAAASSAMTETATMTATTAVTETQAVTEAQTVSATAATTDTATSATPAASGKDIVETATENGTFTTLLAAAKAADLVDTLKGPGPLTLFAPTDAAFAALPKDTLDSLMAKPDLLKQVLLYHVAAGKIPSSELTDRLLIKTQEGDLAKITVKDAKVRINDANVVTSDIDAANGIIHVIDSVLVPQGVVEALASKVEAGAAITDTQAMTETNAITAAEAMTATATVTTETGSNAPAATATVEPTATSTATEMPTATATVVEPTATSTATAMPTATATTVEPTATSTATAMPTATATVVEPTATSTATAMPTATATVEPTATEMPTATVAVVEPTVAPTAEATTIAASPQQMPETGGSFSSGATTLPVVILIIVALAASAFVTRQRPT